MPLPFAFSTQRQSSEAVSPLEGAGDVRLQGMDRVPVNIYSEPLEGAAGGAFSPVAENTHHAMADDDRTIIGRLPPARSPNFRLAPAAADLAPAAPPQRAPSNPLPHPMEDLSAQLEQLRNDVFGIAMSVSALNDRLDRLEQRAPQGAQLQNAITTMQGQIETWLENHLSTAVEHCMHRLMTPPAASPPPAAS